MTTSPRLRFAPLVCGFLLGVPLFAQSAVSPDELPPTQAAIEAQDFLGVFERVHLMPVASEADVEACLTGLDAATTADEAAAMVPEQIAWEHPEVLAFIESGTLPAGNSLTTGEQVPTAPAAGGTLLSGYPPPYGHYPSNPLNNWGMPNSPTGGCGGPLIRDTGLYFDFTRACRQHDLAYRWTPQPPSQRQLVENRFLSEMLYDCSLRNPVSRVFCAIRAAIYYTATSTLGGPSYGGSPTPGYNADGKPLTWPAPYAFCNQPSHAWVHTGGFGNRVPRNQTLWFTGVVRPLSRVRFELLDSAGQVALRHTTHASYLNCVVRHEPEAVPAWLLPTGVYQVRALFTPWETEQVTQVDLGPLEIYNATGTTTCNQYSHVWVHGAPGPLTAGATIFPTGVVRRLTPASFQFVHQSGWPVYYHTTQTSRSNCVIHHEPEARSTAGWLPGRYTIVASYTEWETDLVVTRTVGHLDIVAGSSGGDDGGGGGQCRDPSTC